MAKEIAVAVIHGMGAQRKAKNAASTELTFSEGLHKKVRNFVGKGDFDTKIAWREVYWASVLQDRQDEYFNEVSKMTDFDKLRRFVMFNLADAASYRPVRDPGDNTYAQIHKRLSSVITELKRDTASDAPLIILAHSLGGHILSNFIYDAQKANAQGSGAATPIERMETVAKIYTFGCNIPVFVFAYPKGKVKPIAYPGSKLPDAMKVKPWWVNFYDRDDVLGFPLAPTSPAYEKMAKDNELDDVSINAGGVLTSWNPMSHNAYWTDRDMWQPVARKLAEMV